MTYVGLRVSVAVHLPHKGDVHHRRWVALHHSTPRKFTKRVRWEVFGFPHGISKHSGVPEQVHVCSLNKESSEHPSHSPRSHTWAYGTNENTETSSVQMFSKNVFPEKYTHWKNVFPQDEFPVKASSRSQNQLMEWEIRCLEKLRWLGKWLWWWQKPESMTDYKDFE